MEIFENVKPTNDYAVASKRLIDHLGFSWKLANNTGGAYRRWFLITPEGNQYTNAFTSMETLAHMIMIANWDKPAGYGMSHADIHEIVNLDVSWKMLLLEKNHSWEIDEVIRLLRKRYG